MAAAGGLTASADPAALNLARFLSDGEQIIVPALGQAVPASSAAGGTAIAGKVNINTADEPTLETLPRVGPAMAARILAWRAANGRFTAVEDLMSVSGIGEKTFEGLQRPRDDMTAAGPTPLVRRRPLDGRRPAAGADRRNRLARSRDRRCCAVGPLRRSRRPSVSGCSRRCRRWRGLPGSWRGLVVLALAGGALVVTSVAGQSGVRAPPVLNEAAHAGRMVELVVAVCGRSVNGRFRQRPSQRGSPARPSASPRPFCFSGRRVTTPSGRRRSAACCG